MCLFVGGGEGWFKYRATPSRLHTFVDCRIKWLGGYHALTTYLWCWSQQGRNIRNDGKHTFHVDDFDSHFTWTTIHAISWLTSSYISKYSLTTAQQAKSDVPIKLPMSFRAVVNSNLNPNRPDIISVTFEGLNTSPKTKFGVQESKQQIWSLPSISGQRRAFPYELQ